MINIQASYSRISCFNHCKQQYKYRYLDKINLLKVPEPNDALIIGNTLHLALETNLETARGLYLSKYPVVNNNMIDELIKLEILVPKVKDILSKVNIYKQEFRISNSRFVGIVDLITKNDDNTIDVFDFKYSNNVDNYLESAQLHIYKYFLEKLGYKVNKLGFIFIPKWQGRQKKDEDLYQFRKRMIEEVDKLQIQIAEVKYDPNKVIDFMSNIVDVVECEKYDKNTSKLCDWCDYKNLCLLEDDLMLLPSNTRREKKIDENPDMWIYADSYVGKSTFVDQFEDLLFLNTDGNTDNTTSPVIRIADEVTTEGRITKRKLAWDIFLDVVTELEKKDNDFKRVCIDLVEDLYEHCRVYIYNKLGIQHESDSGFGKGWDIVRTEFLKTIKRLKNLGYQMIYISKEVSSEVTLRNGSKFNTYKPNIQDKIANVLAGTVDLTVRCYLEKDKRYMQLSKDENTFGGGRFNFLVDRCELDINEFKAALVDAQSKINKPKTITEETTEIKDKTPVEEEEKPKTRRRRRKKDEVIEESANEEIKDEELPF